MHEPAQVLVIINEKNRVNLNLFSSEMAITPKKAASAASKKNVSSAANKAMKEGKSLKDAISAAKKGK